jgi:hypothetical protein
MKDDQRPSLEKAKLICTPNSICVEIGTWDGGFASAILEHTPCKTLYCVDPYKHFDQSIYKDGMNDLTQQQFDEKYNRVKKWLTDKYGSRVVFLRMTSEEAVSQFENNSIDFVYVDGNHGFEYVYKDIDMWYPKVKQDGFLCGDDVYSRNLAQYDADKNILMVWSRDSNGTPTCWGRYGTYPALLEHQRQYGRRFLLDGTQFMMEKL